MNARGRAGWPEVLVAASAVLLAWRLAVPWDQSARPTSDPNSYAPSLLGWLLVLCLGITTSAWLGWRGRPRAIAWFVLPLIALASWRAAEAEVIGANMWPVSTVLAGGFFAAMCGWAAAAGYVMRKRHRSADPATAR